MSLYLLLKTLHILSSTLLFGTGLGSAYYALRAWLSKDVRVIAVTFRHLVTPDWLFIATPRCSSRCRGWAWCICSAGR